MEPNNYDFINNQQPKNSRGLNSLNATNKKQRTIIVAIGMVIIAVIIFGFVTIMNAGKKSNSEIFGTVAAAQADLLEITKTGQKELRSTDLLNSTSTVSLVLTTHSGAIRPYLGKDAEKIITPYRDMSYNKLFESSLSTGTFDKEYETILANRIDLYSQKLIAAYDKTNDPQARKKIEELVAQTRTLSGEPTKPTGQ